MKTKRILSLALTLIMILGIFVMPTSASAEEPATEEVEIFIENENISEETRAKIIAYFSEPDREEYDATAAYGLTCTLFGHELESTTVRSVTHKVRTTAPRCLQKTYDYNACTRCDYEDATLLGSSYIFCCS